MRVPNLDPDAEIGDRLLEVGMWITNALDDEEPFKFRGAVNYVLEPWPTIEALKARCEPDALEHHEAMGVFQLMDMNIAQDVESIEREIVDLLQRYGDPGEFVLAGRGVSVIERPMLAEWLPGVSSWLNDDTVLDISGVSYTMALAGLSEELEPHYEPIGPRAMHSAQGSFLEFQHYTKVFQAVPLLEAPSQPEE